MLASRFPETKPDLSLVIVNWNTLDELRTCLRSVAEAESEPPETIVVENASTDGSAAMVREEFPQVRLLVNKENFGFARASNQGIRVSHGRYILLLNPDTEVRKGAFSALVQFGDENPEVGIFGPKVLNIDGSLQYSCRRFPTLQAALFRNVILSRLFPRNPYTREYLMAEWEHNERRDVDWVSGAALIIRRETLDSIGGLDERFFMYCEDVDIAYRAWRHGWRVAYFPEAVVVHARGKSSDKAAHRMTAEFHKSMYRFFQKHYAKHWFILTRVLVPFGLFLRASLIIVGSYLNYLRWLLLHRSLLRFRGSQHDINTETVHGCSNGGSDES